MENNHFAPMESLHSSQGKDTQSTIEFHPQFTLENLNDEIQRLATETSPAPASSELEAMLETESRLREKSMGKIEKPKPILKQGDVAIIYPNTINVIQGQAGSHKSRLVETICSAFLKTKDCENELLGFQRVEFDPPVVVYVDTERNLKHQFPFAIQSMKIKAGHKMEADPMGFRFLSLLETSRQDRFKKLEIFLRHVRAENEGRTMFIVLDVGTDFISDFNRVDKSMELIDFMNMAVNKHDISIMCLIHENPGSEKARGHFGTELMNKATTHITIGFEKDSFNEPTDLIKIKFLKTREGKKPSPVYVKYCDIEKGLVVADPSDVATIKASRKQTAPVEDVIEKLELIFDDGSKMPRAELVKVLRQEFSASQKTVDERIKEIVETNMEIFNRDGVPCHLHKERDGKEIIYSAKPMNHNPL